MRTCAYCSARAQYRDRRTGQFLCLEHARVEVVAPRPVREPALSEAEATGFGGAAPLTIRPSTAADVEAIEQLALYFWDETEVECFDRQYDVRSCLAFLACEGDEVVGLASYAVEAEQSAIVVVMLNVLPTYQGRGAAWALLDAVRGQAVGQGLGRLLVATTNDDLPSLALYQRYGFRLLEVLPGHVVAHHGGELLGFSGIPVRDEIRLEYCVSKTTSG